MRGPDRRIKSEDAQDDSERQLPVVKPIASVYSLS
jgi:hypothetical protein